MKTKIAAFWNGLPHYVQAMIVLFSATFFAQVAKGIQNPDACLSLHCWRQYLAAGYSAGLAAVAGLYLKSSLNK